MNHMIGLLAGLGFLLVALWMAFIHWVIAGMREAIAYLWRCSLHHQAHTEMLEARIRELEHERYKYDPPF